LYINFAHNLSGLFLLGKNIWQLAMGTLPFELHLAILIYSQQSAVFIKK
jgi:hypothetical protein